MNDYNKKSKEQRKQNDKYLPAAIRNKRYLRGAINAKIKEMVNPRQSGEETTNSAVRKTVLRKTGGRCFYCHRLYTENTVLAAQLPKVYFSTLQIDHLVPHSKRGPNSIANYVPACQRCNLLKSDHTFAEFSLLLKQDQRKRGY